jgi:hypothetical protein
MELRPSYPISTLRLRLRPLGIEDTEELLAYRGRATFAATCRLSRWTSRFWRLGWPVIWAAVKSALKVKH